MRRIPEIFFVQLCRGRNGQNKSFLMGVDRVRYLWTKNRGNNRARLQCFTVANFLVFGILFVE